MSSNIIMALTSPSRIQYFWLQTIHIHEIMNVLIMFLILSGIFILNFVSRRKAIRDELSKLLNTTFEQVTALKMPDDVNELFFCWNHRKQDVHVQLKKAYDKANKIVVQKKIDKLPCKDFKSLSILDN